MAGVYEKHTHRITGMVGIDRGQLEQLAGNNALEKKLEFDPKMRQFMQLQNVGPCHLPLLPQYKVTTFVYPTFQEGANACAKFDEYCPEVNSLYVNTDST